MCSKLQICLTGAHTRSIGAFVLGKQRMNLMRRLQRKALALDTVRIV